MALSVVLQLRDNIYKQSLTAEPECIPNYLTNLLAVMTTRAGATADTVIIFWMETVETTASIHLELTYGKMRERQHLGLVFALSVTLTPGTAQSPYLVEDRAAAILYVCG